jgi:hypothetical protein
VRTPHAAMATADRLQVPGASWGTECGIVHLGR